MAYDYERELKSKSSTAEVDLGLKAYMNKVYSFMAVGLALTGVIAHLTSSLAFDFKTNSMTPFGSAIYGSPLAFIIMLAPLGFIIALNMGISRMKEGTVQVFILGVRCCYGSFPIFNFHPIYRTIRSSCFLYFGWRIWWPKFIRIHYKEGSYRLGIFLVYRISWNSNSIYCKYFCYLALLYNSVFLLLEYLYLLG